MDESEYQQAREQLNQCPCPFEKAILSSCCGCQKCQRLNIAEREAVTCTLPTAQACCVELLNYLQQNAQFALKLAQLGNPLPHIKAMKLQCGGLLGLQFILSIEANPVDQKFDNIKVENIYELVTKAIDKFEKIERVPLQELMKFISHYQVRSKRSF
jgi:hypothetical protein